MKSMDDLVGFVHPSSLVNRYGAKAGYLIYISQNLPEVSQTPMVVKEIGEPIDLFLARMDEAGIPWPRMFRSSAKEELLIGSEGVFPTKTIEGFDDVRRENEGRHTPYPYASRQEFEKFLHEWISGIEDSPTLDKLKESFPSLGDKINVIGTYNTRSEYGGTLIEHPNREGVFLASVTKLDHYSPSQNLYSHGTFLKKPGKEVKYLEGFSSFGPNAREDFSESELEKIIEWYSKILKLPDIDRNWAYQMEFGVNPTFLYQIRPFKKKQKADFSLPTVETKYGQIVIGVTPQNGIQCYVKAEFDEGERGKIYFKDNPVIFNGKLRLINRTKDIKNLKGLILHRGDGLFKHEDIMAIRKSEVAVILETGMINGHPIFEYPTGTVVKLVSDGRNVDIRVISKTPF